MLTDPISVLEPRGESHPLRVAILDLYEGLANQGMRCIHEILDRYASENCIELKYDVFDVRQKLEVPDLSYDIYISTGGPGSPVDTAALDWDRSWCRLMDNIYAHNKSSDRKKHVFLICHSFQLLCRHWDLAQVSKRKSTTFGTFPVHQTPEGLHDPITGNVSNPFYVVDSRDWQVTQPRLDKIEALGASILAIEKERPHVPLERAIMAMRFSPEFFGTQFHPEADAYGMAIWMQNEAKKEEIIRNHSETKYYDMLLHLNDPDKILLTQRVFIPVFLDLAVENLQVVNC